ncbi:hypothetical protein MC885_000594 [Smutsia gigantea]|nr:hypothetical protein MC885_000594 [Smutsia gigantea]
MENLIQEGGSRYLGSGVGSSLCSADQKGGDTTICAMAETGKEEMASAEASGFSDLSDSEILESLDPEDNQDSGASLSKPDPSSQLPGKDGKLRSLPKWKRGLDVSSPMERFHLKYLYVTDLSTQDWCEQQIIYGKEFSGFLTPEKAAVLDTGSSIHLARELEVHDFVTIPITTKEDAWAVKFLNILSMIPTLQAEGLIREFPVFGEVEGVLLVGVIDELHYTTKGELELVELKTRRRPALPLEAQKKKDCFQVSLYKYIFDAMVQGKVTTGSLIHHAKLCPEKPLGPSVLRHAQQGGFSVKSLGDLMELVFLSLTLSDLPVIDILKIEYIHQETATVLGTEIVAFEEKEISVQELQKMISFQTWQEVELQLKQHFTLHEPQDFPMETFALWNLVKESLAPSPETSHLPDKPLEGNTVAEQLKQAVTGYEALVKSTAAGRPKHSLKPKPHQTRNLQATKEGTLEAFRRETTRALWEL